MKGSLLFVLVVVASVLADDGVAVVQFYSECNGANWVNEWDITTTTTTTFCNFTGVTCDTNRIISLNLSSNNIECAFPDYLCELTQLEFLDLSYNSLTGPIPNCISNLVNLQYLILDGNEFEQEFPSELCDLTNLMQIDLSANRLTGSLPDCLNKLSNLVILDLHSNKLCGQLPKISTWEKMSTLNLRYNKFTGTIPSQICFLPSIDTLDLSQNSISGTIPDCIGNLTTATELLLYTNKLTGTIPNSIGDLTSVNYFDISVNRLTGSIPVGLCSMSNLQQLYLSVNQLSSAINPCVGYIENLAFVDFSNNLLDGTIPDSFSYLTNMISMSIGDNKLYGTVPSFADFSGLELMDLSNNRFEGPFIDMGDGLQLRNIFLKGNHFSGELPETVCGYLNMRIFNIENNAFNGSFPNCISQLQNLQNLEISGNKFYGSLPDGIGYLSSLLFLRIGSNNFTGIFPTSFANLVNLRWLDASSNPFGTELVALSRALFLLPNLMYLNLANISAIGGVDYQMFWADDDDGGQGCFPSLVHAVLANNQLTGTIPSNINWWQRVATIDLSQNFFTGAIPSTLRLFYTVNLESNPYLKSDTGALPNFLAADYSVSTLNQTGHFYCPSMMSNDYPIKITIDPLYYNFSQCNCAGNYFGENGKCKSCLDHGSCAGGKLVTIPRGYYPTPSSDAPQELIPCVSNKMKFSSCNPNSSEIFHCEVGYTGRKCSQCIDDYYNSGGHCVHCRNSYIAGLFIVTLFLAVFTLTVLRMRRPSKYGTFKILLLWGQTSSALLDTELPWPSSFTFFREGVNVSSIGINGIFGFECLFNGNTNSPVLHFYLAVVTPVILVLYDCGLFIILYLINQQTNQKLTSFKELKFDFLRFVTYSTMLFYFPVAKAVMSAFNCEEDPITHIKYLASAPYIVCASNTLWSNTILPTAIVLMVLFVFGFPAVLVYFLITGRKHSQTALERTIGFLYAPYKKKLFYFGYIQLGRSLLLSIVIGILPESSTFRRLLILAALLCFLAAQIHLKPYIHKTDNYLEAAALMCLVFTFTAGLAFGSLPSSPDAIATAVFVITLNIIFLSVLVIILVRRFMHMLREMATNPGSTVSKIFPSTSRNSFLARSFSVIMQVIPSSYRGSSSSAPVSPEEEKHRTSIYSSDSVSETGEDEPSIHPGAITPTSDNTQPSPNSGMEDRAHT